MKENLTEMVFIIDRSGSMSGLENDTIKGFNSMIEKQRKSKGEARITTVLFNDYSRVLHDNVDIKEVRTLTEEDYCACGSTALLDAMGKTIKGVTKRILATEKAQRPAKVMVVIITDGEENSSKEFSIDRIQDLIKSKTEDYNWEFLFLGANIDAISTANKYGIKADNAVNYNCDSIGTQLNFTVVSDALYAVRQTKAMKMPNQWKDKIDKDFKERKKTN